MFIEFITGLILSGNTEQAKREIYADNEFSKVTGRPEQLNHLQKRDLIQAITERELAA